MKNLKAINALKAHKFRTQQRFLFISHSGIICDFFAIGRDELIPQLLSDKAEENFNIFIIVLVCSFRQPSQFYEKKHYSFEFQSFQAKKHACSHNC